jgi:hypothetical protein
MSAGKRVLVIGLDPSVVDIRQFPGLTPEKVRTGLKEEAAKLTALGYEVKNCFIDLGETAVDVVTQALAQETFDCIVIGAGVRTGPDQFLLFERLINVVHANAPAAKIGFNTKPTDTAEAVQRWI